MKHSSIKLPTPCEFINVTPINPLISKCQIKVCYVGEDPNRNRSIITKEVATSMANSLPGSPIVGFYNEETKDFEEHSKELVFKNGKFQLKNKTKPYGFVDIGAKVWFQKFLDDGVNEREYLMTEGYLWTGQYPECKQVIEHGSNHSMELDKEKINAHWTKDINGNRQFFIINEAIFSALCILGEDEEPCFEGSQISVDFSFDDNFKQTLEGMIYQLQEIVKEGGKQTMNNQEELEFKKGKEEEDKKNQENNQDKDKTEKEEIDNKDNNKEQEEKTSEKETEEDDDKKKKTKYAVETCPKCNKPIDECTCKKTSYSLDEISEYVSLKQDYEDLQTKFSAQETTISELQNTIASLTEFKANAEKKEKEEMIKSFYMLSDEDKKEVIDKIDEYSLDDIEAKLSILCVRNKVNFNLEEESEEKKTDPVTYNLKEEDNSAVPAWVRAVIANQK